MNEGERGRRKGEEEMFEWDWARESGSGAGEQRKQEIEPEEDAVAGGSGDGEESGRRLGAEAVVAIVVGRVGGSYAFDGIECAMAGVRRPLIWQYCSRRVRGQEVALDSCAGGCCAASPLAVDRTRMILAAAPTAVRSSFLTHKDSPLFNSQTLNRSPILQSFTAPRSCLPLSVFPTNTRPKHAFRKIESPQLEVAANSLVTSGKIHH